jgi:heat shock protein HslJ
MRLRHLTLTLLSLFLVLAACSSSDSGLTGTSWNLETMAGQPPVEGSALTLAFTADTASGSAGCNTFTGGYSVSGDTITFGDLASTMMACSDELNAQETAYLGALDSATAFDVSGDQLTLTTPAGELVYNAVGSGS